MKNDFSKFIIRRGMTASDLSKLSGISLCKIDLAMKGIRSIPKSQIDRLKALLCTSVEEGMELNALVDLNGEDQ